MHFAHKLPEINLACIIESSDNAPWKYYSDNLIKYFMLLFGHKKIRPNS